MTSSYLVKKKHSKTVSHVSVELCVSDIFPDVSSLISSSSMFRPLFSDLCVLVTNPHQQLWNFDTSNSAMKSFKPYGDTSWASLSTMAFAENHPFLEHRGIFAVVCQIVVIVIAAVVLVSTRKRYERWKNPRCAFRNPRVAP